MELHSWTSTQNLLVGSATLGWWGWRLLLLLLLLYLLLLLQFAQQLFGRLYLLLRIRLLVLGGIFGLLVYRLFRDILPGSSGIIHLHFGILDRGLSRSRRRRNCGFRRQNKSLYAVGMRR